jgi:hypothetical protein
LHHLQSGKIALSDLDAVGASASVEIVVTGDVPFQERLNLYCAVEVQPAGWQKQHRRMRRPNRISEASANSRIRIPL